MNKQTADNQPSNYSENVITWTTLTVRIIIVYVIFAFASHEFFPISTYNLAPSQFLSFLYYRLSH